MYLLNLVAYCTKCTYRNVCRFWSRKAHFTSRPLPLFTLVVSKGKVKRSAMQAVTPAITISSHLGGVQGEGEEVSNAGSDPSHHH
jgi:hypothetical protein